MTLGEGREEAVRARIELFEAGRRVAAAETDSAGNFELLELGEGNYEVVVSAPGFVTARQQIRFSYPDRTRIRLNLHLPHAAAREKEDLDLSLREKFRKAARLAEQGDSAEAIEHYLELIGAWPSFAPFWHNLGSEYLRIRRYPKAREALEEAARLDPDRPETSHNLGLCYYQQARWSEAAEQFQRVLELEDGHAPSHYYLGMSLLRLGSHGRAEGELLRALDLDSEHHPDAHLALALLYLDFLDRPGRAARHLESFLAARPSDPKAPRIRETLSRIHRRDR